MNSQQQEHEVALRRLGGEAVSRLESAEANFVLLLL
jgi:hypothetical protein